MTEIIELEAKLNQHVNEFRDYRTEESEKFSHLLRAQQENTDAIAKLTRSVSRLVDDTSAIVQLHKDFTGAARVGKGVQDFIVWCMKWGMIGAGVATMIAWVLQKFNH